MTEHDDRAKALTSSSVNASLNLKIGRDFPVVVPKGANTFVVKKILPNHFNPLYCFVVDVDIALLYFINKKCSVG